MLKYQTYVYPTEILRLQNYKKLEKQISNKQATTLIVNCN